MCRGSGQVRSNNTCCRWHRVIKNIPKLKPHEAVIDMENIVVPGLPEGKDLHDRLLRMYNNKRGKT